jgi:hypothetical protein
MSEFEGVDLSEDVLTRVSEFLAKGFIESIRLEDREGASYTILDKVQAEEEPILFSINVRNRLQRDFGLPNSEAKKISELIRTELKEG